MKSFSLSVGPLVISVLVCLFHSGNCLAQPGDLNADFGLGVNEPKRIPVIFLPGVGGSELYSIVNGQRYQVWPFSGANRIHLQFGVNGQHAGTDGATIEVGEVMKSGFKTDFYGKFLNTLIEAGWKPGKTLFEFPYDWRQANDSDQELEKLHALVLEAKRESKQNKVALVAHSMGGIRARVYVLHPRYKGSQHVDRIITMGTPYGGAAKVYYGLVHGYDFGNPTVNRKMMKVISQNIRALYQLMPHQPFIFDPTTGKNLSLEQTHQIRYRNMKFNHGGSNGAWEYDGDDDISRFRQWNNEIDQPEHSANQKLARAARKFYQTYGMEAGNGGVPTYVIAGCWTPTLSGFWIREWADVEKSRWAFPDKRHLLMPDRQRKIVLAPNVLDGDGTVPLESALLPSATKTYVVADQEDGKTLADHGSLPANPYVRQLAVGILKNKIPAEKEWQFHKKKIPFGLFHGKGADYRFQKNLIGTSFVLRSHSVLRIKDDDGRITGYDEKGRIRQEIPGSLFYVAGDAQYAFVFDPEKQYHVEVDGVSNGKFNLEVTSTRKRKICAQFEYQDVSVSPDTLASVNLRPKDLVGVPPPLMVSSPGGDSRIPANAKKTCDCGDSASIHSGLILKAASVRVQPGENARLKIELVNAKDISNMNFDVLFNDQIAQVTQQAVPGGLLSGVRFESNPANSGMTRIGFAHGNGISGSSSVAYLNFRAVGQVGERTPVRLKVTTVNHPDGGIPDVQVIDGEILIVGKNGFAPGDTDGSGEIDERDAGDALKMSVGLIPVNMIADVDGDGKVTSRDATRIMQMARDGQN